MKNRKIPLMGICIGFPRPRCPGQHPMLESAHVRTVCGYLAASMQSLTAKTMRLLRQAMSIKVITMKTSVVLSLSAAMIVAGCASTLSKLNGPDAKLNYAEYAGEPVSSFWMSNVDGWAAVSNTEIFVRSRHNQAYLVDVAGYCPNLQFATTIGFTSSADEVDRFSKVIFGHERCLIQQIRSVDMARLNADRNALRERPAAK